MVLKQHKTIIARLISSAVLFVVTFILAMIFGSTTKYWWLIGYIPSYLIISYDVIAKALGNIKRGKVFDENFLMIIATFGAFAIGEYPEAVFVMLFYQVGELFQDIAVNNSRQSIGKLLDIRPDYANKLDNDTEVVVDPFDLVVGDLVRIKAGERVATDCEIVQGRTTLDTSALTGESLPRDVAQGDTILSGSINLSGTIVAKVTQEFGQSTASKIVELIENASSNKSKKENFIAKFARFYTPFVVFVALFLAVVPPLIMQNNSWEQWIHRALTFLVVSCPCALVISIPLSFFAGIGKASRNGILFKGSNYLEALSNAESVVFDKTGTLTEGKFVVQSINAVGVDEQELLKIASYVESFSNHPIASAIVNSYGQIVDQSLVSDIQEISGKGVKATYNNMTILVGNDTLMHDNNIVVVEPKAVGTIVYIAINNNFGGSIVVADKIKDDSKQAILGLKKVGIKNIMLLSGDNQGIVDYVANQVGINKAFGNLLPADKVQRIQDIQQEKSPKGQIVFVGDGINDAPVLARADIGVAMGGIGSDIAIETADVVIMTDEPSKVEMAIDISRRTIRIARQNIIFSLAIKFGVLALSAVGIVSMWMAVFADVGVSVIAILNAMRLMKNKK